MENADSHIKTSLDKLEQRYTPTLVRHVVCLLLCGRHGGLTAEEVRAIFTRGEEFRKRLLDSTPEGLLEEMQSLAALMAEQTDKIGELCTGLLEDLAPLLVEKEFHGVKVLTFGEQFQQAGRVRYLEDYPWRIHALPEGFSAVHHLVLAAFFRLEPLYLDENRRNTPNLRKLDELPWQQTVQGSLWEELCETLTNIPFMDAKAQAGMLEELYDDYLLAQANLPENREQHQSELQADELMKKYIALLVDYAAGRCKDPPKMSSVKMLSRREQRWKRQYYIFDPTLPDKIRPYFYFVRWLREATESSHHFPGFLFQQAANHWAYTLLAGADLLFLPESLTRCFIIYKYCSNRSWPDPFPVLVHTILFEGAYNDTRTNTWHDPSFTPDGKLVAVKGALWRISEKPSSKPIKKKDLDKVVLSADGTIAVSAMEEVIEVRDILTGELIREIRTHILDTAFTRLMSFTITPDAGIGVGGHFKGEIRVWDLKRGRLHRKLEGHRDGGTHCAVSANGKVILSCSYCHHYTFFGDSRLFLWDVDAGTHTILEEGDSVSHFVAITPDGSRGVAGSLKGRIVVWDLEKRCKIKEMKDCTGGVSGLCISADGQVVVASDFNGNFRVWEADTGYCQHTVSAHDSHIRYISLTADARYCITMAFDSTLRVWDLAEGIPADTSVEVSSEIVKAFIMPDNVSVLISRDNGEFELRNLTDGKQTALPFPDKLPTGRLYLCRDRHTLLLKRVSRSIMGPPDMHYFGLLEQVSLNNPGAGKLFETSYDNIYSNIVETSDGSMFLFVASGRLPDQPVDDKAGQERCYDFIAVHRRKEPEKVSALKTHIALNITNLSMHPDGRHLLSGSSNSSSRNNQGLMLHLWDLAAGTILGEAVASHKFYFIKSIGFTPDGQYAYMIADTYKPDQEEAFMVWQVPGMSPLWSLKNIPISSIPTPEGRYFIGYDTGFISKFAIRTGEIKKFPGGGSQLVISPCGGYAIVKRTPLSLGVWDIKLQEWVNTFYPYKGVKEIIGITPSGDLPIVTQAGEMVILKIANLQMGLPVVTPYRMWLHGEPGEAGHPDPDIKADCKWCGETFVVPAEVTDCIDELHRVAGITKERTPLMTLPDAAWENQRLISPCPKCGKQLKYNPFVS